MITAAFPSKIPAPEDKPWSCVLDASEYQRAKAGLELYLTLSGFNDKEQSRIVEHVMSRAVAYGNADSATQNIVQELHRFLVSRGRPHALQYAEGSSVWSLIEWRAAAWLAGQAHEAFPHAANQRSVESFEAIGSTRFSSMPPIQRGHMVPEKIEYVSCRGIWRSLVAWFRDKPPQAQLSFGKIPPK
jgi:hypothetical protein